MIQVKRPFKTFFLFVLCGQVFGCSAAGKIDELLTLKNMSDSQKLMEEDVKAEDQRFEAMLNEFGTAQWKNYTAKTHFLEHFGQPIVIKHKDYQDRLTEIWVYRYSTRFFDSPKIYLYFDDSGVLLKSDLINNKTSED